MQRGKKPKRSPAKGKGRGRSAKSLGEGRSGLGKEKGSRFEQALTELTAFLDGCGAPAAVIGGIAVVAWGFGRSTLDIDVAIAFAPSRVASLLKRMEAAGFEARIPDAAAFARENLVLLMRHSQTGVDVDVSLAQLDFEKDALHHSEQRPFGSVLIRVPRATDLIIYKMLAARPRDIQDVEELVSLGLVIDTDRIERVLGEFDVDLGLDRANQWRRLIERSGDL